MRRAAFREDLHMDTTGVVQRSVGKYVLLHGKFAFSGTLREVEGKWAILDGAWLHTWTDAEFRQRGQNDPPIFVGDDFLVSLDYVEACVREEAIQWVAEERKQTATRAKSSKL